MEQATINEAREEIVKVITGTFISFKAVTEPKMRKTDNPYFGQIEKHSEVAGHIGFDYETIVEKQAWREGKDIEFQAQAHRWAEGTDSKNIVKNKAGDKEYLRVKIQTTKKPTYYFNGEQIEKSEIEAFLPKSYKPHTQDALDTEVVIRNYGMENIREIKINGRHLEIVPLAPRPPDRQATPEATPEVVF